MKYLRGLIAVFFGTLVYVVSSSAVGVDGIWAQKQLEEQKRILSLNDAKLKMINEDLKLEKLALEKDMDVIASYARKLGFVSPGEKIVKIMGLGENSAAVYDFGTVLKHQKVQTIPEEFCKAIGFAVGLLVYLLLLFIDYNHGKLHFSRKTKSYDEFKDSVSWNL